MTSSPTYIGDLQNSFWAEAILFNFDNTLINYTAPRRTAFLALAEQLDLTDSAILDDMDERTTREILAEMLREIGGRYDGDELDRYVEAFEQCIVDEADRAGHQAQRDAQLIDIGQSSERVTARDQDMAAPILPSVATEPEHTATTSSSPTLMTPPLIDLRSPDLAGDHADAGMEEVDDWSLVPGIDSLTSTDATSQSENGRSQSSPTGFNLFRPACFPGFRLNDQPFWRESMSALPEDEEEDDDDGDFEIVLRDLDDEDDSSFESKLSSPEEKDLSEALCQGLAMDLSGVADMDEVGAAPVVTPSLAANPVTSTIVANATAIRSRPGVEVVLEAIRHRKWGFISSSSRRFVQNCMTRLDMDIPRDFLTSDDPKHLASLLSRYRLAILRLDAIPSESVIVEGSVEGVKVAASVGAIVIGVCAASDDAKRKQMRRFGAKFVVDSLGRVSVDTLNGLRLRINVD